jgi:hypothetical protein
LRLRRNILSLLETGNILEINVVFANQKREDKLVAGVDCKRFQLRGALLGAH